MVPLLLAALPATKHVITAVPVAGAVHVNVQDALPAVIVLGVLCLISVVPFKAAPKPGKEIVPPVTDKSKPASTCVE